VEIRLSGLAIEKDNRLQIANRIYESVFDEKWVKAGLKSLRPYAESMVRWLASGGKDDSSLLRGKALEDARVWAQGEVLADADHQFLEASGRAEMVEAERALTIEKEGKRQAERRAVVGSLIAAAMIVVSIMASL